MKFHLFGRQDPMEAPLIQETGIPPRAENIEESQIPDLPERIENPSEDEMLLDNPEDKHTAAEYRDYLTKVSERGQEDPPDDTKEAQRLSFKGRKVNLISL